MFGNLIKVERLNMRKTLCFGKTGNCIQRGPRAGTDGHVRAAQVTGGPVGQSDLYCSRSYEPSGPQDELRARFLVVLQVHFVQPGNHVAFALTNSRHINGEPIVSDAKFLASAEIRRDLCTVNDVFAWQTCNVRT